MRKTIITILIVVAVLALMKQGCNEVKRITFDKLLDKTQNYMLDMAKGDKSKVSFHMDAIDAFFSDSITQRVVICIDAENSDSSYLDFIESIGYADKVLVICNFEDGEDCIKLSDRFLESGIDFLNLKGWPIVGNSYVNKLVFKMDQDGHITNAFRAEEYDVERVKELINDIE